MLQRYLDKELLDSFLEETADFTLNITNKIDANHTYRIKEEFVDKFINYRYSSKNDHIDTSKYFNASKFFDKVTDKVIHYKLSNTKDLKENLIDLISIILDKNTYGILAKPFNNGMPSNRESDADYINITNPLAILDTHKYYEMTRLFMNNVNETSFFIFKYDADKYPTDISDSKHRYLYNYLKNCCDLFNNHLDNGDEIEEQESSIQTFFTIVNTRDNQLIFNPSRKNYELNNYITYSDILVKDSVAPTYAVWKLVKGNNSIAGRYLLDAPVLSPNISTSGTVCCGSYSNQTTRGINTLIVSNLRSPFTTGLFHKDYFRIWVEMNKVMAIRWICELLNVEIEL